MKSAISDAARELKPLVTVAIPTWNGAERINFTLEALATQDADPNCFEVVIVDNDSPETGRVSDNHPGVAALRQKGIECRVVSESRRGLVYARIRGVLESRSELVCFLDDDTEPVLNYIAEGISALSNSAVGVLISRVYPKYEAEPSKSILRREHLLAINNKLGDSIIEWDAIATIAPTLGAGMWVRREAFLSAIPWQNPEKLLSDRTGKSLTSGGDIEIGYLIGKAGYRRVYSPHLKLRHLIPVTRLNTSYFCRLIVGTVRSHITLESRYLNRAYSFESRIIALARLILAALASPYLLLRKDGYRELLFVLASRWAGLIGPYDKSYRP